MRKLFNVQVIMMLLLVLGTVVTASAKGNKKDESTNYHAKQILIVGLHDNVKSNYFYNGMIDREYNSIIAENIAAAVKEGGCKFIPATDNLVDGQVLNEIKVNGESEDSYSDLSAVPTEELQKVLNKAGADYLLVLNQHYLKWQEQPLRTLFHIVSYSLYDKDKKEIYRGNNYFTCMNLENPDKVRKISRKSSSKIASSIIKTLED